MDRLLDLLPPLDVADGKSFMTMATAIFADYPAEVWQPATKAIVRQTPRPTLDVIAKACAAAFEPIERDLERQHARESHLRGLPPPREKRTPEEQARVDAQVERARRLFPPRTREGIWAKREKTA